MKKFLFLLPLLALLLITCDYFNLMSYKEWLEGMGVEDTANIFLAGTSGGKVCYWKNGNIYDNLENNNGASAYSVYASGENVYISGSTAGLTPCYWKNDKIYELSDGSAAMSIFAIDGDVYVAGYAVGPYACYWKNGVKFNLDAPGGANSMANSIFVVNNGLAHDVYVGGYYGTSNACYWKNGKMKLVKSGLTFQVKSIYVKNDKVYSLITTPCSYFIDNTEYSINNYNSVNHIFVDDSDVYIAGEVLGASAGYWINGGDPVTLSVGTGRSIVHYNNDILMGGDAGGSICYWKNSNVSPVYPNPTGSPATFSCMYVTRKIYIN